MFFVIMQLVTFLFRGIEDVISILIRAAVALDCAVEAQTPSSRGILNQERLEDEVMVA